MKGKICLLMPVAKFHGADATSVPPYALLYIGTALEKAGYEVDIYHENGNVDKVVNKILSNDNVFVGISAFTGYPVWLACQYAKRIKELSPGTKVVLGGYHASMLADQCLNDEFFDFAVLGEGEETAVELANVLQGNGRDFGEIKGLAWKDDSGRVVINEPRSLSSDIDHDIDWGLIDVNRYVRSVSHLGGKRYFYIFSSRGCPKNCSFCAGAFIYKRRYRKESVGHVLKTYKPLLDEHNVELIEFLDDNFLVDLKWAEKIVVGLGRPYRALLRLDRVDEEMCDFLNRTKCRAIFVGVESGNSSVRNDIIHKDLTDKQIYDAVRMLALRCPDINVSAMFIAGIPGETYNELMDTCFMAVDLTDIHPKLIPQLNIYTPYPMCESYLEAVKRGWVPPSRTEDWNLDPKPGKNLLPVWLDYYNDNLAGKLKWMAISFMLLRRNNGHTWPKSFILAILRKISIYRLRKDCFIFPIELWLFWKLYLRMIRNDVS